MIVFKKTARTRSDDYLLPTIIQCNINSRIILLLQIRARRINSFLKKCRKRPMRLYIMPVRNTDTETILPDSDRDRNRYAIYSTSSCHPVYKYNIIYHYFFSRRLFFVPVYNDAAGRETERNTLSSAHSTTRDAPHPHRPRTPHGWSTGACQSSRYA